MKMYTVQAQILVLEKRDDASRLQNGELQTLHLHDIIVQQQKGKKSVKILKDRFGLFNAK